jgi:hypothetical protein
MYQITIALLYKHKIKCENHTGAILLLEHVIKDEDSSKKLQNAKKARINSQYYNDLLPTLKGWGFQLTAG